MAGLKTLAEVKALVLSKWKSMQIRQLDDPVRWEALGEERAVRVRSLVPGDPPQVSATIRFGWTLSTTYLELFWQVQRTDRPAPHRYIQTSIVWDIEFANVTITDFFSLDLEFPDVVSNEVQALQPRSRGMKGAFTPAMLNIVKHGLEEDFYTALKRWDRNTQQRLIALTSNSTLAMLHDLVEWQQVTETDPTIGLLFRNTERTSFFVATKTNPVARELNITLTVSLYLEEDQVLECDITIRDDFTQEVGVRSFAADLFGFDIISRQGRLKSAIQQMVEGTPLPPSTESLETIAGEPLDFPAQIRNDYNILKHSLNSLMQKYNPRHFLTSLDTLRLFARDAEEEEAVPGSKRRKEDAPECVVCARTGSLLQCRGAAKIYCGDSCHAMDAFWNQHDCHKLEVKSFHSV